MILITGGTGMLGSNLLLELVKNNNNIIAIKRKTSNLHIVEKLFTDNNLSEKFNNLTFTI